MDTDTYPCHILLLENFLMVSMSLLSLVEVGSLVLNLSVTGKIPSI